MRNPASHVGLPLLTVGAWGCAPTLRYCDVHRLHPAHLFTNYDTQQLYRGMFSTVGVTVTETEFVTLLQVPKEATCCYGMYLERMIDSPVVRRRPPAPIEPLWLGSTRRLRMAAPSPADGIDSILRRLAAKPSCRAWLNRLTSTMRWRVASQRSRTGRRHSCPRRTSPVRDPSRDKTRPHSTLVCPPGSRRA